MLLPETLGQSFVRYFSGWWWSALTCIRHSMGRWYIFRDVPTWFVNDMAACTGDEMDDPLWPEYVALARDEATLRFQRMLRDRMQDL